MSGKTRLVVETVRKNYPSTPVCFPKGNADIQHLIDAPQSRRRESIIILDDVDRFISNQTLSLGQLNVWIREARIVIATMMKSRYTPWRDGAKDKLPGWDIVNRFTILQMDALLTEHEQTALLSSSYADLATDVKKVGLAPLLGGAPKVRQRLEEGREQHLWGYALVRAAADWRRVGLGPATKTQIQKVALVFKDDIAWGKPNWKKAWKWASEKSNDTVSLICQTGSYEWEVLDLVADEADWPLNQQTLEAMAGTEHSPRQALAISLAMHKNQSLDNDSPVVKRILKEADEFLHKFTTKSTSDSNSFGLYAFFLTAVRPDCDRAEAMYERAIKADPNHARNLGNYALFLKNVRREYDRAEAMFERAIKADPNYAHDLGAYALFLTDVRREYDRAQDMFERAITADPNHAHNLGNYAIFLTDVRREYDRAQDMYERAIKADPNHAHNLGNYAIFFTDVRREYDRAQDMYERAITADPNYAHDLGAYAIFLKNVRREYDRAQDMFERAITADPNHAHNLGNYANFLTDIRRDSDRAQDMYDRAITADPNHAHNLGNYANFLWSIRSDHDQAQDMYDRAVKADPNHANNLGNYANFLKNVRREYDRAEAMYERAITADPTDADNLGNYANFLKNVRHDYDRAQAMYDRAIDADPTNARNLGNYSQLLFATGRDEAAIALATRTLSLAGPGEKPLVAECRFYLFAHSPEHRRESGENLRDLLAAGVTTGSWSFEPSLERLRREKDPRYDLVRDVADALSSGDTQTLESRGEWYAL